MCGGRHKERERRAQRDRERERPKRETKERDQRKRANNPALTRLNRFLSVAAVDDIKTGAHGGVDVIQKWVPALGLLGPQSFVPRDL